MDKYVLSIMLEEVLSCANRFLTRFSRDRYTLWSSQERIPRSSGSRVICIEVSRLPDGSADAKVVAANKEK